MARPPATRTPADFLPVWGGGVGVPGRGSSCYVVAHNVCYVIFRVELANGGCAEARGGGVLYYCKAADSLFLCGVLSGDCVWWLTTLCGGIILEKKKGQKRKVCIWAVRVVRR
jgi:hypothetical protein